MPCFADVAFNLPIKKNFTYSIPEGSVVSCGQRVLAGFGKRELTGVIVSVSESTPAINGKIREIERVVDPIPVIDSGLLGLARWMENIYMCSLGEALGAMIPSGRKEKSSSDFPELNEIQAKPEYELTNEQTTFASEISGAERGTFYVYGITGSGKTDVYLRVAREVLERGRGVIYLVPEISLTHQVTERFVSEFGDAAILHSGLSPSRRLGEWMRLTRGEVALAIGARSAVFAPVRKLGLVIIDEEHDGSYKSSSAPRFHARQIAQHRVDTEQALLVLGSATPSIEAYHRFKCGKIKHFFLSKRLAGGKMPEIEIVDMKGSKGPFSRVLIDEMKEVKLKGRQTILFLNRRGFAHFFHCRSCGHEMKCKSCSVSLTFHKKRWKMICHYCGYSCEPVSFCPACGSLDVGYSGFGTEKIEEDMASIFPDFSIRRLDADIVKKTSARKDILLAFRRGEIDVLLGTQMVAKGFNFPGVMLVGIINADTGLHLPDFRAYERTFNLIVQVSGRSGRTSPDGKVVIQTYAPRNEAIVCAAKGRHEEFYALEIEKRKELGFPPFTRLIRLVIRSKDKKKAEAAAGGFCRMIERNIDSFAELLGPAECPISLIARNHRIQIILRTKSFSRLHSEVKKALAACKPQPDVFFEIDVDPVSLL